MTVDKSHLTGGEKRQLDRVRDAVLALTESMTRRIDYQRLTFRDEPYMREADLNAWRDECQQKLTALIRIAGEKPADDGYPPNPAPPEEMAALMAEIEAHTPTTEEVNPNA